MEQTPIPQEEHLQTKQPFQVVDIPMGSMKDRRFMRHAIRLTGKGEVSLFEGDEFNRYQKEDYKVDQAVTSFLRDDFSPGGIIDILLTYTQEYNVAAYSPFDGYFMFGPLGIDLYKRHPDVFWSIFQHEYGHQRYSLLSGQKQRELNNMLTDNPETAQLFYNFVQSMISDDFAITDWDGSTSTAGQNYIYANNADNPDVLSYALSPQGSSLPGIKDHRMMVFEKDGQEIHLILGGVVSEALSYLSSLVTDDDTYVQEVEVGALRRGHIDERYIHIKNLFDHLKSIGLIERIKNEKDFGIFPEHMRLRKVEIVGKLGDDIVRGLDEYMKLREEGKNN